MNERNKRITKEEEGKDTKRKRRERLKGRLVGSAVEVVSCMQKKNKKKHGRVRLW